MPENIRIPRGGFGIMILKDNKVLLGKRHPDPEKADSELEGQGKWTMPGGKLHFQESFEEAAAREVSEETGLKLNKIKVIGINNDMVENAHFVTVGMFSDDFSGTPEVREPEEIVEWRWFSLEELPENIYPPSAKLLENYKQNKFYIKNGP
ncbi:MAG: NUDIX domain-containing protein [archaeon]